MSQPPGYGSHNPSNINPNTGLPYSSGDQGSGPSPYGSGPSPYGQQPQYGQDPSYGQEQFGQDPQYGQAPYGSQPNAPYGSQPNAPYGSQPGGPYGQDQYGQAPQYGQEPYGSQPGGHYGSQPDASYGQSPYGAEASGAPGYAPPGDFSAAAGAAGPYGAPPTGESEKSFIATWLLGWLLGSFGADRFYLGKFGTAIAKLLTMGGLGIWTLIDVIRTLFGATRDTQGRPLAGYEGSKKMARLVTFIVWGVGLLGSIIAMIVSLVLVAGSGTVTPAPGPDPTEQTTQAPTEDPTEDVTGDPTEDPTEDPTQATGGGSSDGPASDETRQWADDTFGTFEAETVSGSDLGSWTVPDGVTGAVVTVEEMGGMGLTLTSLDEDGEMTSGLIQYASSSDESSVYFYDATDSYLPDSAEIEIDGSGSWEVTFSPVSASEVLPESGGSGVFLYEGEGGTFTADHAGESNFIIWEYDESGYPNLLVNEIGDVTEDIDLQPGPSLIHITAGGEWTLTPN